MRSEYPTYPNPTITEVVCDIHFRSPQNKRWEPSFPGEFFKHVQDEYPGMVPMLDTGIQLIIGPLGSSTKVGPQRQIVHFKHATRPLTLQLGENTLSMSILSPYQGWEKTYQDILDACDKVKAIVRPEVMNLIRLRYINQIAKETERDRAGTWLVANDYIPHSILCSEPGFLLRVEACLDTENRLVITLGDRKSEINRDGAIIFDVECICEKEMAMEPEILEQELDRLHTDIWEVFSSAKGEKLEILLNRRLS
jgi:uncharacterized protein (TIGR04255 family)